MDWNSIVLLICLYTVTSNAVVDTGIFSGPAWQDFWPLDCLYSTIDRGVSLLATNNTDQPHLSTHSDQQKHTDPVASSSGAFHSTWLSTKRTIWLLNLVAAIAAVIIYTSPSSTRTRVLTTNALLCWVSGRLGMNREQWIRATHTRSTDLTTATLWPLYVKTEIAVGIIFVCTSNAISWCMIPGLDMDWLSWIYFLMSTLLLCGLSVLLSRARSLQCEAVSQLCLGVVESGCLIATWIFGYSEPAVAIAERTRVARVGISSLQFAAFLWSTTAIALCLFRRYQHKGEASWATSLPAVAFVSLAGVYHILSLRDVSTKH